MLGTCHARHAAKASEPTDNPAPQQIIFGSISKRSQKKPSPKSNLPRKRHRQFDYRFAQITQIARIDSEAAFD
jgi:hypothetical protein